MNEPLTPLHESDRERDAEIEASLAELQPALHAYVGSLVGSIAGLGDIVQDANIVIWEKRSSFERGTNFKAWAFRIAYFKALGHRRDENRRGRFVFNEKLLLQLASEAESFNQDSASHRAEALAECISALPDAQKSLVKQHYLDGISLAEIAGRTGRKATAVYKEISRLRQTLRRSVERRMNRTPG